MARPLYIYTKSYRNPSSDTDGYVLITGTEEKTEVFPATVSGIAVKVADNNVYIQLSNNGVTFDDKILLEASSYKNDIFTLSYQCKAIKLTNETTSGSANGRYQVLGFEV